MLCRSSLSRLREGGLPLPSVDRIAESISHNLYFEKFFAVFAQKIRPRQGGSEKRSVQTVKKSRPADMCGWTGHRQGNSAPGVCEPPLRRVRGSAMNFVPRGSGGEARPVDETASRRWRSAPIFASARAPRKPAKRKRVRGRNFCRAAARRNGSPLKRVGRHAI